MVISNIMKELESNPNIQEEIRNCIIETFSDILKFLGDRNFKRWLLQSHLSSVARKTIYKVSTEENDEFLKKNPKTLGYHEHDEEKRKIVLRKGTGDNKYVVSHENFHALANGLGGFDIFIGEGITEILSKILYDKKTVSYSRNVDIVSLLYDMYSDTIFRDYFLQKGDTFFDNLMQEASNNGKNYDVLVKMYENKEKMIECFTIYHNKMYNKDNQAAIEDARTPNQLFETGRNALIDNYVIYLKYRIQDFQYIKDGKVDFDKFLLDISTVFIKAERIGAPSSLLNPYLKDLTSELIENSHLLVDCTNEEEKKQLKLIIMKDISEVFLNIQHAYNKSLDIKKYSHIDQEVEPYISLNKNQSTKMANTFLTSKSFLQATDLLEILNRINSVAKATNMDEEQLSSIFKIIGIDLYGDYNTFLQIAQNYEIATAELEKLKRNYDQTFSRVQYVHISSPIFENELTYIEKKDNTFSILSINEKTGELTKLPLQEGISETISSGLHIEYIYRFSQIHNPEIAKNAASKGKNTYQLINYDNRTIDYMTLGNNLDTIVFSRGKILSQPMNYEDIKKDCLTHIALKGIEEKIKCGEYSTISEPSTISPYTRKKIKISEFLKDYRALKKIVPELQQVPNKMQEVINALIDKTFETPEIIEASSDSSLYTSYCEITAQIGDLLNRLTQSDTSQAQTDETIEKLQILEEELNLKIEASQIEEMVKNNNSKLILYPHISENNLLKDAIDLSKQTVRTGNIALQKGKIVSIQEKAHTNTNQIK